MSAESSSGETSKTLTDRFLEFLKRYYRDDVGLLAQRYPKEERSLAISYDDLYQYDREIAQDWLREPEQMREYAEEALRLYDLPADVSLSNANVRLIDIPDHRTFSIGEINPEEHFGELIGISGQVIEQSDVKPLIQEAAFECLTCGTMSHIPQTGGDFQEPHECHGCERQGPFDLKIGKSKTTNFQRLIMQKPPEEAEDGQSTFDIKLYDDLVKSARSGDRVTVASRLQGIQETNGRQKKPTIDLYGDANSVTCDETDWSDANVKEHLDEIREIGNSDDPFSKVVNSIKRSHMGHDEIKLAIALQLFQGVEKELPDGSEIRGTIHVLLIGDPGVDKTGLLNYAKRVTPGAIYTDGSGSTKAGLTATAVQSDIDGGGWTIRGGALVKANNSLAAIDELDDMEEEDRGGMKESMASGTISVSKGDNNVTLPAYTSVLAAANPKFGRYDPYQSIGEQINLHPALVSRFDLIFPMRDEVDPDTDAALAEHLNTMTLAGQKRANGETLSDSEREQTSPEISREVLRAYIAYARENIHPVLTDEAADYISNHYVKLRKAGEDQDSPVPTTARSILAVHRLAEASARIRLSERVELEDAKRVVKIWQSCMEQIGIDPESDEMDADVLETGESKSQRDRNKTLRGILTSYWKDSEYQYGAPVEEYLADADAAGIEEIKAEGYLENLRKKGEIYEPKQGFVMES